MKTSLDIPPIIFLQRKRICAKICTKSAAKPHNFIHCFRAIIVVVLNDDYVYLYFPLIKISLGAEKIVTTKDDDEISFVAFALLLFNCDCDYC